MEARRRARVLCVDDEPQVLEGLSLILGRRYDLMTAAGGAAGLDLLQRHPDTAVVVSDMRMPGMDGATFLARARALRPNAVRLLLTGHADLDSAIAAVNEGHLFRFLTKPCPQPVLIAAVDAAAEQHRLVTAERVLLQQTLFGSVKALTDVLAIANPTSFGRAARLRTCVAQAAQALGFPETWQVELAAMLSQLGRIVLPAEVDEKASRGQALSEAEQKMAGRALDATEQMLDPIPRLEVVRGILAATVPGRASPEAFTAEEKDLVDRGARLLRAALDLDALVSAGKDGRQAVETLRAQAARYDPAVLEALATFVEASAEDEVREVALSELREGMVFAEDVKMANGMLVIARGHEVTAGLVARFGNFRAGAVREPVRVTVRRLTSGPRAS